METPLPYHLVVFHPQVNAQAVLGALLCQCLGMEHARSTKNVANSMCKFKRHIHFVVILFSIVIPLP